MELGDPVHVRMAKWGERPHWEYAGVWLGTDELGSWVGAPAGTHHHRPGFEFHSDVDTVTLFPHERWWAATFHAPGIWCTAYVDMTTPAIIEGGHDAIVVRCVDLDLDVVRRADGTWYVDDEDEFAEHQVALLVGAKILPVPTRCASGHDNGLASVWFKNAEDIRCSNHRISP